MLQTAFVKQITRITGHLIREGFAISFNYPSDMGWL